MVKTVILYIQYRLHVYIILIVYFAELGHKMSKCGPWIYLLKQCVYDVKKVKEGIL